MLTNLKCAQVSVFLIVLSFAVYSNAMTRSLEFSQEDISDLKLNNLEEDFTSRRKFAAPLANLITKTMIEHNWESENFPLLFTDIVLKNLFGRETEVPSQQLREQITPSQLCNIYKAYFKQVVKSLAKELNQDPKDLEENFELYKLSFDSFFIFQYNFNPEPEEKVVPKPKPAATPSPPPQRDNHHPQNQQQHHHTHIQQEEQQPQDNHHHGHAHE